LNKFKMQAQQRAVKGAISALNGDIVRQ